jgi:hypothetical protein
MNALTATTLALVLMLMLMLMTADIAGAQSNAEIAEKISQTRQENAQRTRNYSWTKRTEVKVKGEVKSTTTELVRYTVDGELQTTPISEDKAKAPKRIKGKIAKKKGGEMKDWMAELGGVLQAYSLPTTGNLVDFLDKAVVVPDGAGKKLVADDVVKPGDNMMMWIDETSSLTRTEVLTEYDDAGVQLTTDHATTSDGLDFVARTVIIVPEKNVEMTVENFSYKLER